MHARATRSETRQPSDARCRWILDTSRPLELDALPGLDGLRIHASAPPNVAVVTYP